MITHPIRRCIATAKSMRNGLNGAENRQRFKAFSVIGETVFELFCYMSFVFMFACDTMAKHEPQFETKSL